MFRTTLLQGTALLFALLGSLAPAVAQEPPGMMATSEYLFVLRGARLYQFDVHTLELKNSVSVGDGGDASAHPPVVGIAEIVDTPSADQGARDSGVKVQAAAPEEIVEELVSEPGAAGGQFKGRRQPANHRSGKAIQMGLDWLVRHQDEDGKWDVDGFMKHDTEGEPCDGAGNAVHDVGMTGLAVLAMLGDGSTLRSGPHKDALKKATQWLRTQQAETGMFGTQASHDFVYNHAIATYAMCEAYGLSNLSVLKSSAQKGINYLESHRNPFAVWRYQPRDGDNDTSVTSWCLLALRSGQFFELQVNPQALAAGRDWLKSVTTPDGRVGYTKPGEKSSRFPGDHATAFPVDKGEAITAAGLFCRFMLGDDPAKSRSMKASADRLLASLPEWDRDIGSIDHYYWYYGTYALYQMGGDYWKQWSARVGGMVADNQRTDGNASGSWDPVGVWGETGGRVYSTALMVLSMQAYYRYTSLVR